MRFWQISRCSFCQNSDSFAQNPRITEKKYNFFKTVFSEQNVFVDRSIAVLWKNLLKNCRQKNKTFTPKPRNNFSLLPKLMKISMESTKNYVSSKDYSRQLESSVNDPVKNFSVKSKTSARSQQKMRKVESVF